nr:sensor histidine kinase [Paracoccus sp. S-4012]
MGFLLSLAILPIGLISLVQTLNLSREAARSGELALLGRTAAAAAGERALIQGALGTADALGPAVLETIADPAACSSMMRNFVSRNASYVYAGFTGLDGLSRCNSSGEMADLRDSKGYPKFMADPSTFIVANQNGSVTGRSVVVVGQPLYRESELLGYVAVSITHDLLRSTHASDFSVSNSNILTFGSRGEVISAYAPSGVDIEDLLPRDVPLTALAAGQEFTFHDAAADGADRIFAVVPIVPGLAFALGSFTRADTGAAGLTAARVGAVAMPLLLWLVSIGVAYLAVFRLVLRHVRELRGQMRRFAVGDRSNLPRVIHEAPAELRDVSQTFHNMARILVRDEAQLEDAVAEKTVLLKEVHHRVKNNLQLIASIINMQSRLLDDPEARRVLRSVQDRVSSLASIYRNLYQAEHLDAVEADRLISDIVAQMTAATRGLHGRMRIETDIRPLTLLPDQAVPLSLLATEALTNALKYAGPAPGEERPWVRIVLRPDPPGHAVLEISNSIDASEGNPAGTGLGSQLIDAFSMQLDSAAETEACEDAYHLRLRFAVEQHAAREPDAERAVVLTSAARAGATH